MKTLALAICTGLLLLGCGKKECPGGASCRLGAPTPLSVNPGCQPLMAGTLPGGDCLLPYPSDFFRVPDATMPSGFRIDHTAARPTAAQGHNTNVNDLFAIDGYSKFPVIVASFPEAISPSGFVGLFDDPAKSMLPSSNVLLLEAATGVAIPHFVDLDPRATDPKRQAIVIHPLVALKEKTRYVVAIHGVKNVGNGPVQVPEGFRRLRDSVNDPSQQSLSTRYKADVIDVATRAGIAQGELQLAWDFTTGSDARTQGDMLEVRELTLAWLQSHTPAVNITSVTESSPADTWRNIEGTVEAPLFLESTDPEAKLKRDGSGVVTQNGTTLVPFTAIIPVSVRDQFAPGQPMAYGHGFFGRRTEVTYDATRNIATQLKTVLFGIDWWGMDTDDAPFVAGNLTDHPAKILSFGDRVHQGMANWLVMTAAIKGPLRTQSAFLRPASGPGSSTQGGVSNAGACTFAPGVTYLGISQGGILGTTMNALNPDTSRVVLHMGGAGFTHMMFRATPFSSFLYFMGLGIPDALEEQKYVATLQPQFDRFDPATYAPHLLQSPLPGAPADRRVLLQNGLGDAEVPNLGTYLLARQVGAPLLTPTPYSPYGLTPGPAPIAGSALALYDFGIDVQALNAQATPAAQNNQVHDGLRHFGPALEQMRQFYADGTIIAPCDGGPCVVP